MIRMGDVRSIFGNRDPREVPLYTITQAAHYLGVAPSTVRAWTVGADYPRAHNRTGRFKPLIQLPKGAPARLTFNNLVEAYVLTTIRRAHKVPLTKVRRAIRNVVSQSGETRPLLTHRFLTDGANLYSEEVGELFEVSSGTGDQVMLRGLIDVGLQRIECGLDGLAARFYPFQRNPNEPRVVCIDPRRSFGKPTVEGTGVTVDIVADLVLAGERPAKVAKEFGITASAVSTAVAWSKRAAA